MYFFEFCGSTKQKSIKSNDHSDGNGKDGLNNEGIKIPFESTKIQNVSGILNDFKKYATDKKNGSFCESHIDDFIDALKEYQKAGDTSRFSKLGQTICHYIKN